MVEGGRPAATPWSEELRCIRRQAAGRQRTGQREATAAANLHELRQSNDVRRPLPFFPARRRRTTTAILSLYHERRVE
nr:hypothetical protein Iba_chr15dCG5760 [Ipomoea batatas]